MGPGPVLERTSIGTGNRGCLCVVVIWIARMPAEENVWTRSLVLGSDRISVDVTLYRRSVLPFITALICTRSGGHRNCEVGAAAGALAFGPRACRLRHGSAKNGTWPDNPTAPLGASQYNLLRH